MPLVRCPDCRHDVSDNAPACPQCGRPIAAITVEQTGKTYKALQAVGVILFFLGLLIWIGGSTGWGVSILIIGTVLYVRSRVGAWWHHG